MPGKTSSKSETGPRKRKTASSNGHSGANGTSSRAGSRANGHTGANGKSGAHGKNGKEHAQARIEFEKFTPVAENPRGFENPFPGIENADARYRQIVEQLPAITYMAEFGLAGTWE